MSTTAFVIALLSALLAIPAGIIAAWPGTREGPVINLGLGLLSLGLASTSFAMIDITPQDHLHPIVGTVLPALAFLLCGAAVVVLGVVLRIRRNPEVRAVAAQITGFSDLDNNLRGDGRSTGA